jgi:hypothetical protein
MNEKKLLFYNNLQITIKAWCSPSAISVFCVQASYLCIAKRAFVTHKLSTPDGAVWAHQSIDSTKNIFKRFFFLKGIDFLEVVETKRVTATFFFLKK